MELYILRHGIAEDTSPTGADRDRRLTDEGEKRSREAGKALKKLGVRFDGILSSPFPRAWKTAQLVADELDCTDLLHECAALSSGKGVAAAVNALKHINHSSTLLVGHEPELSQLVSTLLAGSPQIPITMKKGGLCKLTCSRLEPGAARLEWLLTSKHLSRIS